MRWTVGEVTVTKVVERELPVPLGGLLTGTTPELVASHGWLVPHFVTDDGHALRAAARQPGGLRRRPGRGDPPAVPGRAGRRRRPVIGTHFAGPTAGHVVTDGDTWRFAV